ncbi:hypothetical protein OAF27_01190, partial [Verrucomicrobiales bacterium]|nr:hypothetical protein [Verrucomicrobiales bacterium]
PEMMGADCYSATSTGKTFNPVRHIKRWALGYQNGYLKEFDRGNYDFTAGSSARLLPPAGSVWYDVSIISGSKCTARELAFFHTATSEQIGNLKFNVKVGDPIFIVASDNPGSKPTVKLSAIVGVPHSLTDEVTTEFTVAPPAPPNIDRLPRSKNLFFSTYPGIKYDIYASPFLGGWQLENSVVGDGSEIHLLFDRTLGQKFFYVESSYTDR